MKVKQLSLFNFVEAQEVKQKHKTRVKMPPKHNTDEFYDYDGFVDKFKTKKTTDDCYTPARVYDFVLEWVKQNADIEGKEILRPFFPGSDYQSFFYPENSVVIDNPPFSILSEIVNWYLRRNIKFFLFCPFLTSFIKGGDCCYVIAAVEIEYANGAKVRTNFITNLFPERLIITGDFKELEPPRKNYSKVALPDNIITSARLGKFVKRGVNVRIFQDYNYIRNYRGYKLYGGGMILTDENLGKIKALATQL